MILARKSLSTLRGMKVLNESLAMCESAPGLAPNSTCLFFCPRLHHTLLSNLEELVRVPADNTALESTPAPFDHARDNL